MKASIHFSSMAEASIDGCCHPLPFPDRRPTDTGDRIPATLNTPKALKHYHNQHHFNCYIFFFKKCEPTPHMHNHHHHLLSAKTYMQATSYIQNDGYIAENEKRTNMVKFHSKLYFSSTLARYLKA